MTRDELAIARTVIYASLFDYPLTLDQVHESLLEADLSPSEILHTFTTSAALQAILEFEDGFFLPAGRGDLIAERRQREARSHAFLRAHRAMLRLVCTIPFTRMVALSGSVAHLNVEPHGDLDLFIVTRGRRVWTVTLAVLLLSKLLGRRRIVCANFVLADTHLALDQHDVFTANQVIALKPIAGEEVLDEFLAANPFVRRLYPNGLRLPPRSPVVLPRSAVLDGVKAGLELALTLPSPLIEAACRGLYGWYLKTRAKTWRSPEQVRLQSDYLKLHTQSHRHAVTDRFDHAMAFAEARAARSTRPKSA